jgi:hypothetical protein
MHEQISALAAWMSSQMKKMMPTGTCEQASVMSALGQKQTLESTSGMSALPPKADILRGGSDVR